MQVVAGETQTSLQQFENKEIQVNDKTRRYRDTQAEVRPEISTKRQQTTLLETRDISKQPGLAHSGEILVDIAQI